MLTNLSVNNVIDYNYNRYESHYALAIGRKKNSKKEVHLTIFIINDM